MSDVEEINVGEPCLYAQAGARRHQYRSRVLFKFGMGEDGYYYNEIDVEHFYDGRVILIRDDLDLQRTMLHQSNPQCYYMDMFDKNKPKWSGYDD